MLSSKWTIFTVAMMEEVLTAQLMAMLLNTLIRSKVQEETKMRDRLNLSLSIEHLKSETLICMMVSLDISNAIPSTTLTLFSSLITMLTKLTVTS